MRRGSQIEAENLLEPPQSLRRARVPEVKSEFHIVQPPHSAALARLQPLELLHDCAWPAYAAASSHAARVVVGDVEGVEESRLNGHAASGAQWRAFSGHSCQERHRSDSAVGPPASPQNFCAVDPTPLGEPSLLV